VTGFGDRLKTLRTQAGLSQAQLAGEGLSPGYVSLLEGGKRTASSEVIAQLAVRLGVSTTQLVDGKPSERDQRIELEKAYARLAVEHGESVEARARLENLLTEDGLPQAVRDELHLLLGIACDRSGDTAAATTVFRALFERACSRDASIPVTYLGLGLVGCYYEAGDLHQATATGERALSVARAHHLVGTADYFRLAATVMSAYMALGDFVYSRELAAKFLAEAQEQNQPAGQAAIYWNAAVLAEHEGRLSDALALCERALGLQGELATGRDTPRLQVEMAWLLLADQPPQTGRAIALLEHAFDALNDLGSRMDRARWHWLRSTTHLYQGDVEAAEQRARQAVELVDGAAALERASSFTALNDALAAQGRDAEAADALAAAVAELTAAPLTRSTALQWRELAERLTTSGQTAEAFDALGRALDGAGIRSRASTLLEQIDALRRRPRVPATS
jgi:transcriptional regulator with XRE-family HTH domain